MPLTDQKRRAVIALLAFADGADKSELQELTDIELVDLYNGN